MNILIDPGIMPVGLMTELYSRASNSIGFITDEATLKSKYQRIDPACSVELYPEFVSDQIVEPNATRPSRTISIWRKLIDDHQTHFLYDRSIHGFLSSSLKSANILDFVVRVERVLENLRPDVLVYMATPHDICRWIFSRVAEETGVRVLYFQETLLPWRFALMEGLRRDADIALPSKLAANEDEAEVTADFERRKRGSFEEAFPIYERDRLRQNRGKYYNFLRDLRKFWKRPDLVLNKALCFRTYAQLSQPPVPGERIVSFFLHYQPERTTLPESYGFGQQLAAVLALAEAVPEGTAVYVKEHPSIYTSHCLWGERLPSWYRLLAKIPGVRLLPIDTDPYALIDESLCVATIAGTIGGEALIRGKPVIAFGRGVMSLVKNPALHKYEGPEELKEFLANVENLGDVKFTMLQYLADIAESTYSGLEDEKTFAVVELRQQSEAVRFAALGRAFENLMSTSADLKLASAERE